MANYDHPSYLVRQQIHLGTTTAGASGTSGGFSFVDDLRLHKASLTVRTAGTSSGSGNGVAFLCVGTQISGTTTTTGTSTIRAVTALGSSAAGSVVTTADMNTILKAGSVLYMKNGTDATGVADVVLEANVDPGASF